jgi:hypothetical protein
MGVSKVQKDGFDPAVKDTMKALKHPQLANPHTGLPKMKDHHHEVNSKIGGRHRRGDECRASCAIM